ncbi:uncharacterized protein LOC132544328 [Ylistrum balloti]|uniref:uncharacterized protein LOC132544328 n=1 Tax=Ylistrum balloti TaxID=509963 RepID=UPI002905CCB3|nr:uncharacterized protein LOC132544328 [Ylistrum balloti]
MPGFTIMAEAGKQDSPSNTKREQIMEDAGSDETIIQEGLLIQHSLDKKSKGKNKLPSLPYPDPTKEGDEEEITRKCRDFQSQQNQKSAK